MSTGFRYSTVRQYAYKPLADFLRKPSTPDPTTPEPFMQFLEKLTRVSFPGPLATQILTHKSFAHGREGFNETLAFLGRRSLFLTLSTYYLTKPTSSAAAGRRMIETATGHVNPDAISTHKLETLLSLSNLGVVAEDLGFRSQVRWKPKDESRLWESGERKVLAEALMALVGALEGRVGGRQTREFVLGLVPKLLLANERTQSPSKEPHQVHGTRQQKQKRRDL